MRYRGHSIEDEPLLVGIMILTSPLKSIRVPGSSREKRAWTIGATYNRPAMKRVLVVLGLALFFGAACSSNGSSPTQTVTANSSAGTATPFRTHAVPTLRPADPAVYAIAIARLQLYFDTWANGDIAGAKAMLASTNQSSYFSLSTQLLSGDVTSYKQEEHISDDHFTLIVAIKLHFSGSDTGAWKEGVNNRFVTFDRQNASSPFVMTFATSHRVAS
jgi:hypothetical protein